MSSPIATYSSPNIPKKVFEVDPSNPRYQTTNGKTTGPSEYVLNAGQVDVDKPSEPSVSPETGAVTYLSKLRMELTGLQDDVNTFLTEQMEIAKNKKLKLHSKDEEKRIENEIKTLLDGGEGDDD